MSFITKIDTEYELLSGQVKRGIADAVKIAAALVAVLGAVTAILPAFHMPASDLALIASIGGIATGFISWATRHGIVKAKTPAPVVASSTDPLV
jgi:hypothetical protein